MHGIKSFVNEVEQAVASGDASRRASVLRRVTDLFVEQSSVLNVGQVTVFDEVIWRLARNIELKARAELSDRLADVVNAPRRIVRELAFDDSIQVSRPVLERSTSLDEDDLMQIARERDQDFLLALSHRESLSPRLTDVIVDRGSTHVVRTVASNDGARFSPWGFQHLVEKARADMTLQHHLRARRDLPKEEMNKLIAVARQKVRETLKGEYCDNTDALIDAAIDDVSSTLAKGRENATLLDDFSEAERVVEAKSNSGGVNEDDVANWLREGKLDFALAGIALLARVETEMVARAFYSPHYDPLLYLTRAIRFNWGTFKLLLRAKFGREPSRAVLSSGFASFQDLSIPTAQRVVRFLAVRDKALSGGGPLTWPSEPAAASSGR